MVTYSLASCLFIIDREGNPTGDPITALESIAALGFKATELFAEGPLWNAPGPREAASVRKALERFGIDPATIHTPLKETNLASPDDTFRKSSIECIANAIRFGADLGARTAVVHPTSLTGLNEFVYSPENFGDAVRHAYDAVSSLVTVAQEAGIRIVLENLSSIPRYCRPLVTMQELRAFIAGFPFEDVGLCLDIGHARISGLDPADQARIGSDRLWALHIQDVDGIKDRHWVPGRGVVDWSALGKALSDIDFKGDWTIEVLSAYSESSLSTIGEECAALKRFWEKNGMCNPNKPTPP